MKITLQNTTELVELNGAKARVWEGETEGGVRVFAIVSMVAVHKDDDQSAFERELQAAEPAPYGDMRAFPARMIL